MTDVYSTPQYLSFIRAIRERPDDDQPRLTCSDWLEEQGEADRAAFIRVQIRIEEIARSKFWLPDINGIQSDQDMDNCRLLFEINNHDRLSEERMLKGEEKRLHLANYSAHLHTLPLISHPGEHPNRIGIYSGNDGYAEFRRGFVESIRIRGADWIEHATEILARNPVREVTLVGGVPVATFDRGLQLYRLVGRETMHQLTDYIDGPHYHPEGWLAERLVKLEWPGVAFTFEREDAVTLEARRLFTSIQVSEEYAEYTREMYNTIAAGMGIPSELLNPR